MTTQSPRKNRFRQIMQLPPVRMAFAFAWMIGILGLTQAVLSVFPTAFQDNLSGLIAAGVAVFAYTAFVRVVEQRAVTEFAAAGALPELATGVGLGTLLFTVTILILWGVGAYEITQLNQWDALLPAFSAAAFAGFFEEILFRALLFRLLESSLGTWLSLLLSALLFGLLHLFNPNATLFGAVAIALEAGILLAAAYLLTRRLWLAIGIHFAWNFTQAGIFGVAVSGNDIPGFFRSVPTGPEWLSGGEFGAEASVVAIAVCLLAGILVLQRAYQQGRFLKPAWRR